MSIAAIAAIMLFNLVLMVTGACLLWGIRGWESWGELLRLLGLAYLTAVCCFGVVLVNALVIGVPFGWLTLAGLLASLAAGGLVVGRLLDRRLPQLPRIRPIRRPRHTAPPTWIGTLGVSGLVLYLEATFRAGRIAPLQEWDAIAFWIPKAEAILTFGGLDERFFSTLPGPSYSPQVPALVASTFRFIGHPDPITIHLQFWFLFVGFMAAVAGLLAPRVRPLFLWPPLLLVALAPEMVTNVLLVQADKLLDYFVALGLILIALWLVDRQPWQLVLAGAFLSGAMLTKREGFLLVACLIAAALVASWSHKRETWPQLLGTAAIAFALTRPWHHWFASRGIASDDGQEGPALGYLGFVRHPERIWPSLRLTLETLFASDVWLLVTPLVIVAVLAAALVGSRLLALYAGSFLLFGMLACSWVTATTES
ncbi:MAG: glycosyltransferase family 39 protein, partial [Thermoleophilia bacterium]|nr:glycosyltransferase family 39 protein [Thermoleophilia bacterium]